MIQLKNITVSFHSQTVLKDVELFVEKGESLVIVGPSGLGKTVLLKTFAGLIEPNTGTLEIDKIDFHHCSADKKLILLKKMGMLFQKNALFDSLTCGNNIAFPLREVTKLSEKEIDDKVNFFLDAVGISHAKNLYPDEISGGMQKRLGIARALALDPEIILYDDPTAGLDPITSKKIIELIIDLKKQKNSTIVSITNDMNRAFQLADKIIMVLDKEIIFTGTPEQTKNHLDPRVKQFIHGRLDGPLTALQ